MNNDSTIKLHLQASDLLFKHFETISRIFSDVLGLLEVDYIGIALLTPQKELLFFSSRPSIEWSTIEHNLWLSDPRFQHDFFMQEQARTWYYMQNSGVALNGLSIPSTLENYQVVYTFASESSDIKVCDMIHKNISMLVRIGRFCLNKILSVISLPNRQCLFKQEQPKLKLIINKNR